MKSSSGDHYLALDHVRALAAFLVFTWHFTHAGHGFPVPFEYTPAFFPLALLNEGHTGVALFMTLSGYLFAKLLDGKTISYRWFLWNRALRLLPLLAIVIVVVGVQQVQAGVDPWHYVLSIAKGVVLPTLPNGGWSITVETHYYLLLPVLLYMFRRSLWLPLLALVGFVAVRYTLFLERGEIQTLAYWTIIGRADQFVLGMVMFHLRERMAGRHWLAAGVGVAFCAVFWTFDSLGGFYRIPSYPSPSLLWVVLPTIEGLAYATLIAWYDGSFSPARSGMSRFIGIIGTYSYSIYLLHFFIVFRAAEFVHHTIMDLSSFPVAVAWAGVAFLGMVPLGYLSYRFIEAPFLRLRKTYTRPLKAAAAAPVPVT